MGAGRKDSEGGIGMRLRRILVAVVLVLMSFVMYLQECRVDSLANTVYYNCRGFDLSALDSCGIITDGQGHGSCVVVRPNLILTAGHCIGYPNSHILIKGQKYPTLNKWRSNKCDVGFVVVDANLPYLDLGLDPVILQDIYLVGTPRDISFESVITKGVVSKISIVYADSEVNLEGDFICDAMAWCGGSGGPVLDINGRILGIYIGRFQGQDNFSVCVPVSQIKKALDEYDNVGFGG